MTPSRLTPLAIALVALLLAPPAEAAVWRVLEALGEVRAQGAAEARWQPLLAGRSLSGVQQVVTGPSGRVILAAGPSSLSVEPGSRVVLPRDGTEVLQERGRVRYRAAGAMRVLSPHAAILLEDAVVEIRVEGDLTQVHVVAGSARLQEGGAVAALAEGTRRTLRGDRSPTAVAVEPEPPAVVEALPRTVVAPPSEPAVEPAPERVAPQAAGAPIPLFPARP